MTNIPHERLDPFSQSHIMGNYKKSPWSDFLITRKRRPDVTLIWQNFGKRCDLRHF